MKKENEFEEIQGEEMTVTLELDGGKALPVPLLPFLP